MSNKTKDKHLCDVCRHFYDKHEITHSREGRICIYCKKKKKDGVKCGSS